MKRFLAIFLTLILCCALIFCAQASNGVLNDGADMLTAEEETALAEKLSGISAKHDFDLVIMTSPNMPQYDILEYAEDCYEAGGYAKDGMILLACVDGDLLRYGYVAFGKGNKIFDDDAMDALDDAFVATYKNGNFNKAFTAFATKVDVIVDDYSSISIGTIIIAILIGAVLSFLIPMSVLKGQLKSVRMQAAASSYVRTGSMVLTKERDMFLYRNVTRTAKPKNNSSGGTRVTSGGNRGRSG